MDVNQLNEKIEVLFAEYPNVAAKNSQLAAALGVKPAAVSQWLKANEDGTDLFKIPYARLKAIAELFAIEVNHFAKPLEQFISIVSNNTNSAFRPYIRSVDQQFSDRDQDAFVGRQWLFADIERFKQQHSSGYFLIEGDPGIGKTSILLHMVQEEGHIHHFNIRNIGINNYETFIHNICAQLIINFNLPFHAFKPEYSRDGYFLNQCIQLAAKAHLKTDDGPLVIVIDALDELDEVRPNNNILYLPKTLPEGVFIILTSRRDRQRILHVDCIERLHLDQDDPRQLGDIKRYIAQHADDKTIGDFIGEKYDYDQSLFIDELTTWSQGNFMYMRYVLADLKNKMKWGMYQNPQQGFPKGLQGYYELHWHFIREQQATNWERVQLPVILALTAYRESLNVKLLAFYANKISQQTYRQSDGLNDAEFLAVLELWAQFIYCGKNQAKDINGELLDAYRLYHNSFKEFVNQLAEIKGNRVLLAETHELFVDLLTKNLDIDANSLKTHSPYEEEDDDD